MVKRITSFVVIFCLLYSLTGCWDSEDVNNKSLITLVALDRRGEEFVFFVEVPNLSLGQGTNGEGGGYEQYSMVTGRGDTLIEARRSLNDKMDKPIFLGTVRTLLLTEEMAKYGIDEYINRMQSEEEYRKAVDILITSEKLEDLFAVKSENNVSLGYSIEEVIRSLKESGQSVSSTTSEVLEYLASNTCFVLPNIGVVDGDIACIGYAIIHEGMYYGLISVEDALGLIWILGDHPKWHYIVPMDDYQATVEVSLKKRVIKPEYQGANLTLGLRFDFQSKIMYLSRNANLGPDEENIIKEKLLDMISSDIDNAIIYSKSVHCEYLGFKDYFRISYPNEINHINWLQTYLESEIYIVADTSIEAGGLADFDRQGKE